MKQEKAKGKTILYSTHYMEEAENICDRVIMINKGIVIKRTVHDGIGTGSHIPVYGVGAVFAF